jgi:hypothetical protein
MDNILIHFTAPAEGLQPAIVALEKLETVDKRTADQAKKTMDAYQKRDKAAADGATKTVQTIDQVATAFKGLDKSITGGAYTQVLKTMQAELKKTHVDFDTLSKSVSLAERELAKIKPNTNEYKQLADTIKQANVALDTMIASAIKQEQAYSTKVEVEAKKRKKARQDEMKTAPGSGSGEVPDPVSPTAEPKVKSLKAELRALKEELARLEDQGLEDTQMFEQLAIKAGKLEDQIGDTAQRVRILSSDTFAFDTLIGGVTGVTAAFSVLQGIIALTGKEDEDLQKALLKVNAAMAVLQGLQQIQLLLQKQSVVMIAVENVQKRAGAIATNLQTAAESRNVVVRYAAAAAQRVLNAVMAANPIGIVLVALAAIASALVFFTSNTSKAKKEQSDLNDMLLEGYERQKQLQEVYSPVADKRLEDMKRRVELAKSEGKSQTEILKMENQIAQERLKNASTTFSGPNFDLGGFEAAVQSSRAKILDFTTYINKLDYDLANAKTKTAIELLEKKKATALSELKIEKATYDGSYSLLQEYYSSTEESAQKSSELKKHLLEQDFKSATAFAEAQVLLSREGSRQELEARITAIRAAQREQLANVNLTAGERVKINANADRQISDLRFAYEKRELEDAKKAVDTKVLKALEGTQQELDYKLEALDAAKAIELKDKTLTENAKLEIETRFMKQREDLIKTFNRKIAEDAINARIAELNGNIAGLELSAAAATNAELLAAKKRLVDDQSALEIISIQASVDTEENKRIRIQAVYNKALADKKQLEREKTRAEIAEGETLALAIIDGEIAKEKAIVNSAKSTNRQKQNAQDRLFILQEGRINSEKLANEQLYENSLITFEEYLAKKTALQTTADEVDMQREEMHQEKLNQIRDFAFQVAGNFANILQGINSKGYEDERTKIQDLYDRKKISEQEYQNRMKTLKKKQAEDDKAMAIFQTLIQQGPTVLKGFQQGGFAGIAAAFTLFFSLLGAVSGTKVPAFKDGKIGIDGPGTGTSDSIWARISRGESVIKAVQTSKHKDALQAINDDRYNQYLVAHELPKLYSNMAMPGTSQVPTTSMNSQESFDYDRLAEAIGKRLEENPQFSFTWDEDGARVSLQKGNTVTEFKNKKMEF